jgi:hypothetical protein
LVKWMRADDARRGHGEIFHPGDALTVPEDPGATLRPGDAPWLKLSEMVDYAREVRPRRLRDPRRLLNARVSPVSRTGSSSLPNLSAVCSPSWSRVPASTSGAPIPAAASWLLPMEYYALSLMNTKRK